MKTTLFPLFAKMLCGLLFLSPQVARATHAYVLDTGGLQDVEELYLVKTLQGIVNRDAPRLFLSSIDGSMCAGADNVYINYLEGEKGFTFTRLKTLGEAITTFAAMKRADGKTPLITGLIKYPAKMNAYYNYWIAANFAAQQDLLPVTDKLLKCQTPMLAGAEFWHKDEAMRGWGGMFAQLHWPKTGGISVEPRGLKSGYAARTVYLDLEVTPKIEVVVSELTPGGTWSLGIRMPTTVNTPENCAAVKVPGLTQIDHTGTFVVDLAATGLFNPRSGRATLQIASAGNGVSVTVKSIRLLDASGREPKTPPYVPKKNVFDGLQVKRDLVTAPPYEPDEEKACAWSMANQRKQCDPRAFGSFAGGAWILKGLDFAIAKKVYLFYQARDPLDKGGYPNLSKLLADLKPPGLVYGWLAGESSSCMNMGHYGARYAGSPPQNFSFWQWVPLQKPGKPIPLPQVREVKGLENKIYVNFSWASCDDIRFSYDLMEGYWEDPNRGKVPVTWGFNPLIAQFAPAVVEFYAKSATPKDSFWGFTAGYTHPSCFSPANLKLYAEETRRGLYWLGISPAVDVWDSFRYTAPVYEELSQSPPTSPGIKLMSLLPGAHGPETSWLDNGTAMVRMDERFHGKSQKNGKTTPESVLTSIQEIVAKYPGKDPKFLTINTRLSPTMVKTIQGLLPANVQIVGMPDFIGLATESGAVAAVPFSDGVGSGDSLKVSFDLHNALGATGRPGKVTWTLPAGWKASPAEWSHGPVLTGSNLKQVVTFTPPEGMTSGTVSIGYKDSRFQWEKELLLTTYPKGITVSDCQFAEGWTASGGASVGMDRGLIKITPSKGRDRYEYFMDRVDKPTGRVTLALKQIDFSRKPILKINIADQNGVGTIIGLIDEKQAWKRCLETGGDDIFSIDLATVTKWNGLKDTTLTLDPVTKFGSYCRIRSIKVCYP